MTPQLPPPPPLPPSPRYPLSFHRSLPLFSFASPPPLSTPSPSLLLFLSHSPYAFLFISAKRVFIDGKSFFHFTTGPWLSLLLLISKRAANFNGGSIDRRSFGSFSVFPFQRLSLLSLYSVSFLFLFLASEPRRHSTRTLRTPMYSTSFL